MTAVLALGIATAAPASAATTAESKAATPQYDLSVGGRTTTLSEGETVVYPMQPVKPAAAHTDVVYPGDGTGTLTVTASGGVYHYSIAMHIPATNFVGHFQITVLTSGLSGGRVLELVFAGDVPTSKLHGHRYSGHLDGEADFAGVPCLPWGRTQRCTPTSNRSPDRAAVMTAGWKLTARGLSGVEHEHGSARR